MNLSSRRSAVHSISDHETATVASPVNATEALKLQEVEQDGFHRPNMIEHLDVIDPAVFTISTMSQIASGILLPQFKSSHDAKLPPLGQSIKSTRSRSASRGTQFSANDASAQGEDAALKALSNSERVTYPDEKASFAESDPHDLDDHFTELLTARQKRMLMYKRVLVGFWAFLKTPVGIVFAIYGTLVVFWGQFDRLTA